MISSVSSNYLASAMLPSINSAQTQLSNLSIESSTGQYADLGLQLGDQSGYELSLRNDDDLMAAMTTANSVTSTNMTTAQNALGSIRSSAQTVADDLVTYVSDGNSTGTLQTLGQSNLQQFISVANTTSAGQYVFGGQNSSTAPIDDYFSSTTSSAKSAVDSAFQSYFGFSVDDSAQTADITSSQMTSFLSGPYAQLFQSPDWGSNWSNASSDNTSAEISPGQTITTSTNANTAGFQQIAQGYTMLSEFGNIGLNSTTETALASSALTAINQGVTSVTNTSANLGFSQSALTEANSHMSTQMTQLQTQIGSLDNVNADAIATQLSTLSNQLEMAYQLTAQIQKLSLAQYIPT